MVKKDWKKVKLGKVLELKYGKGLPKRDRKKGTYPVYGSGGIVDYHNEFLIQGPGIIVGRKGNVGSIFYAKENFFPIDTVFYIEDQPDKYNLKFFYYMLRNSKSLKLSSDAAVPGLNRSYALSREFTIPSNIEEQQKIASILSNYDDLIENNTKRIHLLEKMAKLIYDEWFVKFKFPGHEKVKFVDSELGKIPEGWEVKKVGEVIKNRIKIPKKIKKSDFLEEGLLPIIDQSRSFIAGYTNDTEAKFEEFLPIIIFGDHTRVLKFIDFPFAYGADGIQLIYPIDKLVSPEFLYFSLLHIDLSNFHYARHYKFLKSKEMIIPTENIIRLFDKIVRPIMKQINKLDQENRNLSKTRDLLLPKLVLGEIDVSDLDVKVPISQEVLA